jgi:hypothetical protein
LPRHFISIGFAAAALACSTSPLAVAQGLGRGAAPVVQVGDTVLGRARPGYGPIGVPLGAFRLYPSLETRASYDSNVYALRDAPVKDASLQLVPRLALTSVENRRYAVSLVADGTVTRFAKQTIENNESASLSANGELEIDRDTQLSTGLTLARRIQRRGTEDETLVGVFPPIAYREVSTTLAGERRVGLATVSLGGNVGQFRYGSTRINGVRVDLRDNNFEQVGANGRVAVPLGPALGVFAAASYNSARYARSTRLPDRGSSGVTLLGGVAVATPLISGEAGVGYIRQSFNAPVFGDIKGLNYAVRVSWSPTRLVDVHANVGRSFQRSALFGAAGIRLDAAAVSADYELLRNLLLNAGLAYTISDYRGLDRRERRVDASFGVRYLANATLSLIGAVTAAQQQRASGSALGRDYDRVRLTLGARVHF